MAQRRGGGNIRALPGPRGIAAARYRAPVTASLASLEPLGDRAVRVAIVSADEGRALAAALRVTGDVDDAWHTETHVAFTPRPGVDAAALIAAADADPDVAAALWQPAHGAAAVAAPARTHVLAVELDGPDVDEVALAARMSRDELARVLLSTELVVSFLGFAPGFAYLRGLDARLHLPRRTSPRARVPAGALAIGGGFAAIYPAATSGGWHLVGRALAPMWTDGEPRVAAGDRVRLVRAGDAAADRAGAPDVALPAPARADAAVIIEDVRGLTFVQDGGRVGHMHQGMPPAGALVPSALARANHAVGNAPGAAGLERYGALRLHATAPTTIATDDGTVHALAAGASIELPWVAHARCGYVAIAGGVDVPVVLGGRGTHVRAQLGGLEGRPLRRGDRLPIPTSTSTSISTSASPSPAAPAPAVDDRVIRLLPGPDVARFAPGALDTLVGTTWRLAHASDRMGTRLDGATLPHAPGTTTAASAPFVLGAVEVPPDGVPFVLGPEHPTTGGYPVIAHVVSADLDAFHARPLGATVRFRLPG